MHRSTALSVLILVAAVAGQDYQPKIEPRSDEARKALRKFRSPADLEVSLWASEPDLANPVAFCFDTRGRLYVAETFRLHKGVTDNREHKDWIDEELACRTVADRVAMYRRKFGKTIGDWQREHERIRRLEDTDGDGRADRSVVFADGFKELPDGIAAGLLAHEGRLWFTCIPRLWILEDHDDDGRADDRRVVHDGYGVHTSLLGHDLHGLRIGPDGRLYFSIGDRGFHVVTPERTLSLPDEGAVLRCNLDGSDLEIVHRGLRNPQELAFDEHGNLFTGDNNSDGGDKARWVYVVEGGHSGWQIGFQSLDGRGPWNEEKLWHPHFSGQAAYIVPPIANLANGPSGLTYDPGHGLPARYRRHFFLCEFRGASAISGILALQVQPLGAGFELTDVERLLWRVLPTDVEFGHDGALYVADWTEGWGQPLKGRIYRLASPGSAMQPVVVASARLLREGMAGRPERELCDLLAAVDQRVRQAAQFELVKRGAQAGLLAVAVGLGLSPRHRLARLHAIWGVGQLGRADAARLAALLPLLTDPDHEIRAQVAKVLGEGRCAAAVDALIERLEDRSARVRFFAGISLGRIGDAAALAPLVDMLREDQGRDPYLRHAGVMGLSGMPDVTALADLADDADSGVRLAALVALRRRQSSAVTRFLADADPLVLLEAARAIHDEPIAAAMPELAARLGRVESRDPQLLRRLVNANFRVGDRAAVGRLVALASDPAAAAPARADALRAMTTFADPSGRDRVVNLWRPLPKRDKTALGALLLPHLPALLATAPDPVRLAAVELVDSWKLRQFDAALAALVASEDRSAAVRTAALATLDRFAVNDLGGHAKRGARSRVKQLRQLGVRILARLDPESAVPVLDELARTASIAERQNAITTLGTLRTAKADAVLDRWLDRVVRGDGLAKLQLEVLEAAGKREPEALLAKLGAYRAARDRAAAADIVENHVECLEGGDRGRGRGVFWSGDAAISCQKCHRIGERGGDAGPNLEGVGSRLSRRELLAALLDPSRVIAPGFGTVVFTRRDASEVVGVIKSETATHVTVVDAAGDEQRLARQDIAERSDPVSAMPPLRGLLTKRQLRDLVEFLARPDKDTKDRRRGAGEDQTRRPNLDSSDKEPAAASEDTSKGDGKDNSLGDGKDTDQGDGKDTSQGDGKDNSLGDGKDTGKGDGKDTRAGNARNDGE